MAKKGRRKATQPLDSRPIRLAKSLKRSHSVPGSEEFFIGHNQPALKYVRWFALWCIEQGTTKPGDATKALVERYQRYLCNHRDAKGKPMSFPSQHKHLSHVKSYFSWLARHNHILFNPASELEMPKIGHRLPKAILSAAEADKVIDQPDVNDAFGLRDRAMLELLYSCGIRRRELVAEMKLYSFDRDRKTLMITQGKGKKDRVVPIGQRALDWIERYLAEGRPKLVIDPNEQTLFLSTLGQQLEPDSLTEYVRRYVESGKEKGVRYR